MGQPAGAGGGRGPEGGAHPQVRGWEPHGDVWGRALSGLVPINSCSNCCKGSPASQRSQAVRASAERSMSHALTPGPMPCTHLQEPAHPGGGWRWHGEVVHAWLGTMALQPHAETALGESPVTPRPWLLSKWPWPVATLRGRCGGHTSGQQAGERRNPNSIPLPVDRTF